LNFINTVIQRSTIPFNNVIHNGRSSIICRGNKSHQNFIPRIDRQGHILNNRGFPTCWNNLIG